VFQDLELFEHLDVAWNVGYAARVRHVARGGRGAAVEAALAQVGLAGFGPRRVSELSGGERQRVALARVLAADPQMLLLDEPLGSLDRQLREQLVERLRDLLRASNLPALVVTHDHDEAFALADRVVILRDGKVVQSGRVVDVWRAPADEWVSEFVGNPAAIDVERRDGHLVTPFGAVAGVFSPATARIALDARALVLDATGTWPMVVRHVRPTRTGWALEGVTPGESDPRHPRLAVHSDEPVATGETVRIAVRAERILCFDATGARVAPPPA
jgi:thiamine transport system ATP-binding protein